MDWEVLKQSEIFRDLDEDEVARVTEICEVQELKFDEYIFREGDEGDRLYIIAKGEGENERLCTR